jgi:hypothetical protein
MKNSIIWQKLYRAHIPEHIRDSLYNSRIEVMKSISSLKTLDKELIDPNLRLMTSRLKALKGKFSGSRCFIMGNGPSLNQMDLSLMQNDYVWGSNRIYLLFDRICWRPKFYIAVDRRVVPDNANEIDHLSVDYPESLYFFPKRYRLDDTLTSRGNVYWYNEVELDEKHLPGGLSP